MVAVQPAIVLSDIPCAKFSTPQPSPVGFFAGQVVYCVVTDGLDELTVNVRFFPFFVRTTSESVTDDEETEKIRHSNLQSMDESAVISSVTTNSFQFTSSTVR